MYTANSSSMAHFQEQLAQISTVMATQTPVNQLTCPICGGLVQTKHDENGGVIAKCKSCSFSAHHSRS